MDTTGRVTEEVSHAEGVTKGTQIIQKKIIPMKPNAQTAKKTIPHFQDLMTYSKQREIMEIKHEIHNFFDVRKIEESDMMVNIYTTSAWRATLFTNNN